MYYIKINYQNVVNYGRLASEKKAARIERKAAAAAASQAV